MSILSPEKWRFCKLAHMTSSESDISIAGTSSESPQTSPSDSPQTSPPNSPSASPVPRINKNHGFLKQIIQTQIERDEYEKAITQSRAERDQEYQRNRINQKISQNRYIPPHLRNLISPSAPSQLSPQPSFNNALKTDPYCEFRARARRSLQREGLL